MDRLTEMEAFAMVVDQGGFTDAARKMGISKSAVSKHVSSLEARLGARLLDRTTRKVAPTAIGLAYYDRARRLLFDAVEADALVAAMGGAPAGHLRVAVASDIGACLLVPVLGDFMDSHPGITIAIAPDDGQTERHDLCIRIGGASEGMTIRALAQTTRLLVAAPGYFQRHGRPLAPEDLATHRMLQRLPGRALPSLALEDGRMCLDAAIAGLGIAWLPDFLCRSALDNGLVEEAIPCHRPAPEPINAIHRKDAPKVQVLLDFLGERLAA
ncbi:LysR family transcriptional regulator [Falsirhodobacter xinxiangensis]|uniref:LysR family transcriptional regulator n=1 Tax=Falsirhodobacter xinxiangensis TaxID=2530049 RepID=UPI0010AAF946|nr:LysR family transcriptional regulator [Rhodobacter xinxiangensis]